MVVDFALTQSLIESFTEGKVMLLLSTLNELFDLPSARSRWLLALRRLVVLSRDSFLLLLLFWLFVATTTEHTR